jgi:hypothetical protein
MNKHIGALVIALHTAFIPPAIFAGEKNLFPCGHAFEWRQWERKLTDVNGDGKPDRVTLYVNESKELSIKYKDSPCKECPRYATTISIGTGNIDKWGPEQLLETYPQYFPPERW